MNADKWDSNGFKNLIYEVYPRIGVYPRLSVVNFVCFYLSRTVGFYPAGFLISLMNPGEFKPRSSR